VTGKDSIDTLYGCLKDLPRNPIADLEAEHQAEIEADERWQTSRSLIPGRVRGRSAIFSAKDVTSGRLGSGDSHPKNDEPTKGEYR
jgi:hypothetical protein